MLIIQAIDLRAKNPVVYGAFLRELEISLFLLKNTVLMLILCLLRQKTPFSGRFSSVAGAGLEPATSGL